MKKKKFFISTNGSSGISRDTLDDALKTIKAELEFILENNPDNVIDVEITFCKEGNDIEDSTIKIIKGFDGIWYDENDVCEQFWEDDEEGIFLDRHNFRYRVVVEDEFGDWYIIEKKTE